MPVDENQKNELRTYIDDEYQSYEFDLFRFFLSREQLDAAHHEARTITAAEAGVSYDQMLDMLGEKPGTPNYGSASIWGGKAGTEWRRIASNMLRQSIDSFKDEIVNVCCKKLDYCGKKQSGFFGGDEYNIAIVICDGLASAAIGFPAPITMVTSYLVRNKILDAWCGC